MPKIPMINEDERQQLEPLLSLIRDPGQLYASTTAGEYFDCADHALVAFQIWRRMGRNNESTGAAWRRMMESDCPTQDVMALVAFHVFHGMNGK